MPNLGGCIRTERPLVFDSASPANIHVGDVLGAINFTGRLGNLSVLGDSITSVCTDLSGGLWSALDFYTTSHGSTIASWRMAGNAPQGQLIGTSIDPRIYPSTTQTGGLGFSTNIWGELWTQLAYVTVKAGVGGIVTPTALVHIAAGTATAGTAPLKIPSGVVLATPETGAVEADNNHIYWTNSAGARLQLDNATGAVTLAAAYANGAGAVDQTMTIATAKGGGIVVDASTPAVTTGLYNLEIRQSANQTTPTAISRRGNDAVGPVLEFNKARGTFSSPADDQVNDVFGEIDFVGRLGGLPVVANRITSSCTNVSGGFWSALDFYTISHGTPDQSWRMASNAPQGQLIGMSTDPRIFPTTTDTGGLGLSTNVWGELWTQLAYITVKAGVGGIVIPTALVHIAAGTATVGTAPLKIPSGVVLAATEAGAIETTNDHIYWTNSTGTRLQLDNSAGATTTLAVAYTNGASAADQTMTIATAKGGGVLIDASTAAVTGGLYNLELRQSASQATPTAITRRGNDSGGPTLEFNKARGTFATPADVHASDALGTINFWGRINGLPVQAGNITSTCIAIEAGPTIDTGIDFYAAYFNAFAHVWRIDAPFLSGRLIGYGANTSVEPDGDHLGYLGRNNHIWSESHVVTSYVYLNEVIDSTNAGSSLYSLEIRQSTGFATPTQLNRAGNDALPPVLQYYKTRGTFAAPADVQVNDILGSIDFDCKLATLTNPASRINATIISLGEGGPFVGLDFYTAVESGPTTLVHNWRMMSTDPTSSVLIGYGTYPIIQPVTTLTGGLGDNLHIWGDANINTVYVYRNEVIDSTSASGALYSLEIRQSTGFATPTEINRAGADALPPVLQYYKTRGTFAAPGNISVNDQLGLLNFYGRLAGAPVLGCQIAAVQTAIAPNATSLDFYVTPRSAVSPARVFRMDSNGAGANTVLVGYNDPEIIPDVDHHGLLGESIYRWSEINVDETRVYSNVRMGGGAVGGGANLTIMLTNTAVMPAPQANQAYLGAADYTGSGGAGHATLAVSTEELPTAALSPTADTLIPVMWNGMPFQLLALNAAPH